MRKIIARVSSKSDLSRKKGKKEEENGPIISIGSPTPSNNIPVNSAPSTPPGLEISSDISLSALKLPTEEYPDELVLEKEDKAPKQEPNVPVFLSLPKQPVIQNILPVDQSLPQPIRMRNQGILSRTYLLTISSDKRNNQHRKTICRRFEHDCDRFSPSNEKCT